MVLGHSDVPRKVESYVNVSQFVAHLNISKVSPCSSVLQMNNVYERKDITRSTSRYSLPGYRGAPIGPHPPHPENPTT